MDKKCKRLAIGTKVREVYRVVQFISSGYFGNVYKVFDEKRKKRCALKITSDENMAEIEILKKISKSVSPYKHLAGEREFDISPNNHYYEVNQMRHIKYIK